VSLACPCLHAKKHIAVNVINDSEFTSMYRVRVQNSATDEGCERNEYRVCSRSSLDTSELEIAVGSSRKTSSHSIWLNQCKIKRADIWEMALEHKDQLSDSVP
jgi:hypothetical protein